MFLACIIDYKVFVKGEFCEQDIKDSCLEKELSSIQNEFQPDEADYRNNNLESIYVKNNLSELDRSKTNSSNANNATVHVSCVLKKTHSSLPVEVNVIHLNKYT